MIDASTSAPGPHEMDLKQHLLLCVLVHLRNTCPSAACSMGARRCRILLYFSERKSSNIANVRRKYAKSPKEEPHGTVQDIDPSSSKHLSASERRSPGALDTRLPTSTEVRDTIQPHAPPNVGLSISERGPRAGADQLNIRSPAATTPVSVDPNVPGNATDSSRSGIQSPHHAPVELEEWFNNTELENSVFVI